MKPTVVGQTTHLRRVLIVVFYRSLLGRGVVRSVEWLAGRLS